MVIVKLEGEILKKFVRLACQLSPENLHCDGEISVSQAAIRARQIRREWRILEKKFGRKVTEDEVWEADIK